MKEVSGGGKVHGLCTLLHGIGEVDWEDIANSGKNVLVGEVERGLIGRVGKEGYAGIGQYVR